MYKSCVLVTAPKCEKPAYTDSTRLSGLKSFLPNSTGGILVGTLTCATSGPSPSNPKPQTKTSPFSIEKKKKFLKYLIEYAGLVETNHLKQYTQSR